MSGNSCQIVKLGPLLRSFERAALYPVDVKLDLSQSTEPSLAQFAVTTTEYSATCVLAKSGFSAIE